MRKIDFHTHILPGMDDGAVDREMSLQMLEILKVQGVDTVVLTPHYYSHREPMDRFLERRKTSYETLVNSGGTLPIDVRLGAEVYFSEYLFNNQDLSPLCIDHTKTMLLELPFGAEIDDKLFLQIERLINEYSLNIVLAHIERYPSIVKSSRTIEELLDIGCLCQVNLSSFQQFFVKRRLFSFAKKGYIGVVGTDSHNLSTRKPHYDEGFTALQKHVPQETTEYIVNTMALLLK